MKYIVTQEDIDWVNSVEFEAEKEWASSTDSYKKGAGSNGSTLYKMGLLGEAAFLAIARERPTASNTTFSEVDTRPLKPWERVPYDFVARTPVPFGDKSSITTLVDVKTGGTLDLRVKQSVVHKFNEFQYADQDTHVQKIFVAMFYDRKGRNDRFSYEVGDEISVAGWEHSNILCQKKNEKPARGNRGFMNFEIPQYRLKQF